MVFPGTIVALLVERGYDDASRLGSNHSPRASGRGGFRRSLRMGFSRRRRHASVGLATRAKDRVPRTPTAMPEVATLNNALKLIEG